mgnify:CR=1 FL=1
MPLVTDILSSEPGPACALRHGHAATTTAIRTALDALRESLASGATRLPDRATAVRSIPCPTAGVSCANLGPQAREYSLPLVDDLGSGLLVDLNPGPAP